MKTFPKTKSILWPSDFSGQNSSNNSLDVFLKPTFQQLIGLIKHKNSNAVDFKHLLSDQLLYAT